MIVGNPWLCSNIYPKTCNALNGGPQDLICQVFQCYLKKAEKWAKFHM